MQETAMQQSVVQQQSVVHQTGLTAGYHAQQVDIAPVTVPQRASPQRGSPWVTDPTVTVSTSVATSIATQPATPTATGTAEQTATHSGARLSPVDASMLPRLHGQALLDQLGVLPKTTLTRFVSQHPESLAKLLASPPAPRTVTPWWQSLAPASQRLIASVSPQLVGNLDGIPFSVRDGANRAHLEDSIAELEAQLRSGVGRGMAVEMTNHLNMLYEIEKALDASDVRTLVTVDTEYPGRAAIVIGDLTHADYVSYLIPGMFFTIEGQVGDWADTASVLYEEQGEWLDRLGDSSSIATVAWIGYQTPNLLNVGSLDLAEEGARYLTRAIEGLQQLRDGQQPHVSVVAHSYGSTAAMMALQRGGFEVDALAVVGSPGSAAQSASELAVRGGNVFVGEAGWDPVVNTAFYGSDPGSPEYGARHMSVSGGVDAITNADLSPSYGHNEYFVPGSQSMRNMALIGIGHGDLVVDSSRTVLASK